jgi:hypothetical protein
LNVDVKKEAEIMSRPCGFTRIFFLSRGNQETGSELLVSVNVLNVTVLREEHAKQ